MSGVEGRRFSLFPLPSQPSQDNVIPDIDFSFFVFDI